ncbi:unnamed protein product [Clavelina lepadiformis]|uniref:2-(3-amino-3-carboxypropyl)histidine synthase n=1 Tax=Clavelina lepadiformis TaxID=159417 RepID=A0ABP0F8G2_CLALP
MSTAGLFSSSDTGVLERKDELLSSEIQAKTTLERIDEVYEIPRCLEFIKEHACGKVALQFPDYMLADSVQVAKRLQSQANAKIFLLADTSYGSYDVDEVAAKHVQADLVVHYGKSSLTTSASIKTLFVFGQREIDKEKLCLTFEKTYPHVNDKILLIIQLAWSYATEYIQKTLQPKYSNLKVAQVEIPRQPEPGKLDLGLCTNTCSECQACQTRQGVVGDSTTDKTTSDSIDIKRPSDIQFYRTGCYEIPLDKDTSVEAYNLFYVGNIESETFRNFILLHPKVKGHVFDPVTLNCSSISMPVNKMLMKRYYIVEQVKDARTVGILVGTMGMAGYSSILDHLKKILSQSGKKAYTFVVGKLNPQKLANFPEIDVFVLVACPEESLIDSTEYYKPICTPYEVELACNANREWAAVAPLDFRELLPGGRHFVEFKPSCGEGDMSLITGKTRAFDQTSASSTDVEVKNTETSLSIFHPFAAARFYSERSWKGLEQKLGETPVMKAKEGRSGLPISYSISTGSASR